MYAYAALIWEQNPDIPENLLVELKKEAKEEENVAAVNIDDVASVHLTALTTRPLVVAGAFNHGQASSELVAVVI